MKLGRRAKCHLKLRPEFDPAYGDFPKCMEENKLPLFKDAGLEVEYRKKVEGETEAEAVINVTQHVELIYEKASIPTISSPKVKLQIQKVVKLRKEKMKHVGINKKTGKLWDQGKYRQHKIKNIKRNKLKLCDVENTLVPAAKLPIQELEKEFFKDQNEDRKLVIGKIDEFQTKKNLDRLREKENTKKRKLKSDKELKRNETKVEFKESKQEDENRNVEVDEDWIVDDKEPIKKKRKCLKKQEKDELTNFIAMCER